VFGWNWEDPATNKTFFSDPDLARFTIEGSPNMYELAYIQANGTCSAVATYQWGFSFLILFIFALVLLVWGIGSYFLWLQAHFALEALEIKNIPGEYQSILHLATAMEKGLDEAAEESDHLTEAKIRRYLHYTARGGSIDHQQSATDGTRVSMLKSLRQWWSGPDRWWVIALILCFSLTFVVVFRASYLFDVSIGASLLGSCTLGSALALSIGRQHRSRILIAGSGLLLGCIIAAVAGPVVAARSFYTSALNHLGPSPY
jgi:hypothetical protein